MSERTERTEHTPGPWTVESGYADGWPGVNGEGLVYWIEPVPIPDSGQFEREADAMLAAAAPDLLAACEAAARLLGPRVDAESLTDDAGYHFVTEYEWWCPACDATARNAADIQHQPDCATIGLGAAIAKARGEVRS